MLFAWAYDLEPGEATRLAGILGIGLVLYDGQYEAARRVPAFAYVPTPEAAREARQHPFLGFLVGRDEPNVTGYSGHRMTPAQARADFERVAAELVDHPGFIVPASLAAVGGFWRTLLFRRRFDNAYSQGRGVGPGVAWAPTRSRASEVRRTASADGHTVVSPALYANVNGFFQPVRELVAMSSDRFHVAVWCLKEADSQPFGLFDRAGNLTGAGRRLQAAMRD